MGVVGTLAVARRTPIVTIVPSISVVSTARLLLRLMRIGRDQSHPYDYIGDILHCRDKIGYRAIV